MFHINSISTPPGYSASMYGGLNANVANRAPGERLGPQGSIYFVSVPGLGTLSLEDVGAVGDNWGVKINGGPVWIYGGEGQGTLTIGLDGGVSLQGGLGQAQSSIVTNMNTAGKLTQLMMTLAQRSPQLTTAWNQNAMQTLYLMGYPRTCMYNMDPGCCSQVAALMQSIHLSQEAHASGDIDGFLAADVGGWWSCALCKAFCYGMIGAAFVIVVAVCIGSGVGEAAVAILAEAPSIATIAEAFGMSARAVAGLAARAFAIGAAASLLGSFVDLLCETSGACSASEGVSGEGLLSMA